MRAPAAPADEEERLGALRRLAVLDTPADERFDAITRTAARLFDAPIALVSLVDTERQWFKSRHGLSACETPRDISFCGHAILDEAGLVVQDALADPRFADNPVVIGEPHIRFYAGQPVHAPDGARVGTLCVIDRRPRSFSAADRAALRDLGRWVDHELAAVEVAAGRAALEALAASEARYRDLFENAIDMIQSVGPDGRFEYVNAAWQRALGYSDAEARELGFEQVLHPASGSHCADVFQRLMAGGPEEHVKAVFVARDGSLLAVEGNVSCRRVDGRPVATRGIFRDVTEQQRAVEALRESEARLRAVFDTVLDSIVVIDSSGRVESANRATEQLFGWSPSELVGKNVSLLMSSPHREQHDAYLERYLRSGEARIIGKRRELEGLRRDGSTFPMELGVSEIRLHDRRLFTGLVRDLTERKRVEQLKAEFVSTVSHELRTPLTSIRGSLGLLAGGLAGPLSGETAQMVGIALKNCDRLVHLINDILDVEKIESGKMELRPREVELAPLVRQAIESLESYASQHEVRFELSSAADAQVMVDPDRLQQVLTNLLSNAAKFSPAGAAVVVEMQRLTDPPRARVSVSDRGPGIAPEFRSRIFERFAQGDASSTRKRGGTGLGLAISRAIMEKLGGTIGFDSELGRGSTFWLELPVHGAPRAAPDRAGGRSPRSACRRPIVLHVEDDLDNRSVVSALLRDDADVVGAGSLSEALQRLGELQVDLAIVDAALPDGSGIDLLGELQRGHPIPVVLFSASETLHDVASSVSAALVKSQVSEDQLRETILGLLGLGPAGRQRDEPPRSAE